MLTHPQLIEELKQLKPVTDSKVLHIFTKYGQIDKLEDICETYVLTPALVCKHIQTNTPFKQHKCLYCGKLLKSPWDTSRSRFKTYCNNSCAMADPQHRQKIESTCLKHYGVKNASHSPTFVDKRKQTIQRKYGKPNAMQVPEIKTKLEQTFLQKYGAKNPMMVKVVQEKAKNTCLHVYGVSNPSQAKECKEKREITFLTRYGVKSCLLSPEVRRKINNTRRSKYIDTVLTKNTGRIGVYPLFGTKNYKDKTLHNTYPWICTLCNTRFQAPFTTNGQFPLCPTCNKAGRSVGEIEVAAFISSLYKGDILRNSRKVIPPLELDIYIPELNLAIEYNGEYWHKSRGEGYHQRKLNLCKNKNIKLFYIWEQQWKKNQYLICNFLQRQIEKATKLKI